MDWFEDRGVELHPEADGRVFPRTNDGATIAEALIREATRQHVTLRTSCPVRSIQKHTEGFTVRCKDTEFEADRVLLASGGARRPMARPANLAIPLNPQSQRCLPSDHKTRLDQRSERSCPPGPEEQGADCS